MNVFATTASNATEESAACYWDESRQTFLGDVYSVKWLEDSDKGNIEKETLEQQFNVVKYETNTSQVCQFGDMSISEMAVGNFQGLLSSPLSAIVREPHLPTCGRDAVPGPLVPLKILQNKMASATTPHQAKLAKHNYNKLIKKREFMENKVKAIIRRITKDHHLTQTIFNENRELSSYSCYYTAVDEFRLRCFNLGQNDYALRMLNSFVSLCQRKVKVHLIIKAIKAECTHPPISGIH